MPEIDFDKNKAIEVLYSQDAQFYVIVPETFGISADYQEHYLYVYKQMDSVPFYGMNKECLEMCFSSDIWDFSPLKKTNISNVKLKFNFGSVPECFRDDVKFYCIREIYNAKSKIQSIKSDIMLCIKPFLIYAYNEGCRSMMDLDTELIENYLKELDEAGAKENKKAGRKRGIENIIKFYSSANIDITSIIPKSVKEKNQRLINAEREETKTPDIPSPYFDRFLNKMLSVMVNPRQDVFARSMACVYIILSQTGLRIGEILALEVTDLGEEKLENGMVVNSLRYPTSKSVNAIPTYRHEYTVANELTTAAFKKLVQLHKEYRESNNSSILFAGTGRNHAGELGLDSMQFASASERFFRYLDSKTFRTLDLPHEENKIFYRGQLIIGGKRHSIYYPNTIMFRVHMCTTLRMNGVEAEIVERFMSHLSADMRDYYYRKPKDQYQEDPEYSVKFLRELVDDDIRLNGGFRKNYEAIKKFIAEKKLNVYGSIDDLVAELAQHLVIKPKPYGTCITVPDHSCGEEIQANKILCMNLQCGNEYHNYANTASGWLFMKEAIRSIKICFDRGKWSEMARQIGFLVRFVNERMIPDLADFDRVLDVKGDTYIIATHPDLMIIFEERNYINLEINTWKNMTKESYIELNID